MNGPHTEEVDDVTTAIEVAKAFLLKALRGEKIENLGVEEIRQFDSKTWDVTLGFNRWLSCPEGNNTFLQMAAAAAATRPQRIYKVVRVDVIDPKGLSITNREYD